MLSVASAAFASAYAVLKTMPEHEGLAKKCFNHAQQLYNQAKAKPGIYSDSNPILAKTYKNDNWEQFAYLAAAWLYESTEDEAFLKVHAFLAAFRLICRDTTPAQLCYTAISGPLPTHSVPELVLF